MGIWVSGICHVSEFIKFKSYVKRNLTFKRLRMTRKYGNGKKIKYEKKPNNLFMLNEDG